MKKNNNMLASNDFEFLAREIWARINKRKIISEIKKIDGEIADNITRKGLTVFPYDFRFNYNNDKISICKNNEMLFAEYKGKKVYLKDKYKTRFRAARYFSNILMEQDEQSPHRYLTNDFSPSKDDVVIDIGGAEGIFALDYIDTIKKLYIFECDPGWVGALKKTYEAYPDKVTIIEKAVSDVTDDNNIALDDFISDNHLENETLFIKIDAEANERRILEGASKCLKNQKECRLVVCTYHKAGDEEYVRKLLDGWSIESSHGYMLYYYDYEIEPPYLRKGVLRCRKK